MASLTAPKLPVLDFSSPDLKPGTASWISLSIEVRKALEEFGCFEAVYDTVPSEAHKSMYNAMEDLFNLPLETKTKNIDKSNPDYSYIGPSHLFPVYEGMGIGNAASVENIQRFTTLMWPQGNPSFCETMHSYVLWLIQLEQMIKRMTFESFSLEKYCPGSESTDYLFRVMVYTPRENETKGMVAHTDKSILTILHQNEVHGLEIQTKTGEWLSLTPSPNSFTVMTGDSFLAWSNGRLHSALHRVTMKGNEKRYSLGLFTSNKGLTQAPEELIDEEHPLLFKPFNYLDLLRFYLSDKSKMEKFQLKDYCGV